MTLDENGRALMLVQTTGTPQRSDEYFCYLEGIPKTGGRQLLPMVQLGDRLIGLRLPVDEQTIGATVSVASVMGGVRTPLGIVGIEHWPARAAGFGFVRDDEGGLRISSPEVGARAAASTSLFDLPRTHAVRSVRERAVSATKAVPVVGPTLTRVARVVRGWRA